jgi:hypothetical protein
MIFFIIIMKWLSPLFIALCSCGVNRQKETIDISIPGISASVPSINTAYVESIGVAFNFKITNNTNYKILIPVSNPCKEYKSRLLVTVPNSGVSLAICDVVCLDMVVNPHSSIYPTLTLDKSKFNSSDTSIYKTYRALVSNAEFHFYLDKRDLGSEEYSMNSFSVKYKK